MRKLIFAVCMILSTQAFADAAEELVCNGVDKLTNKKVEFQVEFNNSTPDLGFTNEQAIITKIDGQALPINITFQMFEASVANKCNVDGMGEYLYPNALTFGQDDDVTLKASCGSGKTFDITATCKDLF